MTVDAFADGTQATSGAHPNRIPPVRQRAVWAVGGAVGIGAALMGASIALATFQSRPQSDAAVVVSASYQPPGPVPPTSRQLPNVPVPEGGTWYTGPSGEVIVLPDGSTLGTGVQQPTTLPLAPPPVEPSSTPQPTALNPDAGPLPAATTPLATFAAASTVVTPVPSPTLTAIPTQTLVPVVVGPTATPTVAPPVSHPTRTPEPGPDPTKPVPTRAPADPPAYGRRDARPPLPAVAADKRPTGTRTTAYASAT